MNLARPLLPLIVCLSAATAAAQYTGPGAAVVHRSVAAVLQHAADDDQAELEGYILRRVGKEKYIFSDGKSEIRIEIEPQRLPNVPFDEKTRLRIRGEVEKDFLQSPEIDVELVTLLG